MRPVSEAWQWFTVPGFFKLIKKIVGYSPGNFRHSEISIIDKKDRMMNINLIKVKCFKKLLFILGMIPFGYGLCAQIEKDPINTTITDLLNRTLQQIDEYKDKQPTQALAIANEFIKGVKEESTSNAAGMVFIEIGKIHENSAQYLIALKYYQKALEIFERTKSSGNRAEATYRLAKINKKIGLYENALAYSLSAMEQFKTRNDSVSLSGVYNVLGSIYKYQHDEENAIEYYQRFFDISRAIDNQRDMATALNNIGVVFEESGKKELAKSYYERCIAINKEIGKEYKSGTYYANIGNIFLDEGNYERAKGCFLKSYSFKQQELDIKGVAVALGNLGRYYRKVDSINESVKHYNEAIALLDKSGANQYLKNLYYGIHKAYRQKGDFYKAYECFRQYHDLSEQLSDKEVIKELSFWEWEQKQAKQEKIEKLEKDRQRLIIVIAITILVLLSFFIWMLYQRQRSRYRQVLLKSENEQLHNAQIKNELEIKNKELTIYSLQVAKSGEISDSVIQKLEQTKYNLKKEDRVVIQSIINELKQERKQDQWKEFELCFSEVHDEFFANLKEQFSNLTTKELRLCAFLRMNMSTKDIASMTGQTPHSINIARTRLRKKLNITGKEVDLNQFLSEY